MAKKEILPIQITDALKASHLAFMHHVKEGERHTLTKTVNAQTHGSELKGKFLRCLLGSRELHPGIEGWLFRFPKRYYTKYKWIGDEQWPAEDAECIETGCSFMFVAEIEIAGVRTIADAWCDVDYPSPRNLGRLS